MFFECEYCKTKFKSNVNFEKHFCEKKKKSILMGDRIGRVAFICYQNWRRLKGFTPPSKEIFLNSKFFKSFINFVDFCQKKSIPEKNGYIRLMVDKQVPPNMWRMEDYYNYYIEHFDSLYSPMRQVEITLENLYKIADILECQIESVIKNMTMMDVLKLVTVKKFSPWLLLFMHSFKQHVAFSITEEEHILLEAIINPEEWKAKFDNDPDNVARVKSLILSLKL